MNCDRIAPLYVVGERLIFGHALDRCRTRHLRGLPPHEAALVCGDGDGRFLSALLETRSVGHVDYVDSSRRMTALARDRHARGAAAPARVEFFCADIRTFVPPRTYDLVATHFFLDCFEQQEIGAVVRRIASHAAADATWLVSEFQVPHSGWRRRVGSGLIAALYATFAVTTGLRARRLPDYAAALSACGFAPVARVASCAGLLSSQVWRRNCEDQGASSPPHIAVSSGDGSGPFVEGF